MKLEAKYQPEDIYKLCCPSCKDRCAKIYGRDGFAERDITNGYASVLKDFATVFIVCDKCHISFYFNKKVLSRLFFIGKVHFEFREFHFMNSFIGTKSLNEKNEIIIENENGTVCEVKKTKILDRKLFDYLEKLKLLKK